LAGAEEAIADAARLVEIRARAQGPARAIAVRVPLWALLEALDSLDIRDLEQIARRVQDRLAATGHAH